MLSLCDDIFLKLSEELTDKEKIYLTMICKQTDTLKYKFIYKEAIHVYKICKLLYFDNFECVSVSRVSRKCPKAAKQISLRAYSPSFPPFITHLTYECKKPIINIPQTVTHLTFGNSFNRAIDNIPQSVTHITFGASFDQPIKDIIPSSVTHLYFGLHFDQEIKNYIPHSVTHLKFGFFFFRSLYGLHDSIEEIVVDFRYLIDQRLYDKFGLKIKYDI
uniref:F-box domain-containing protein n=1 Tax=viral metagenome TaxID=1070528 RepID=A0A6C0C8B5_9ZZZZ